MYVCTHCAVPPPFKSWEIFAFFFLFFFLLRRTPLVLRLCPVPTSYACPACLVTMTKPITVGYTLLQIGHRLHDTMRSGAEVSEENRGATDLLVLTAFITLTDLGNCQFDEATVAKTLRFIAFRFRYWALSIITDTQQSKTFRYRGKGSLLHGNAQILREKKSFYLQQRRSV
ncbi:uncharacterized protein F4807DRAFT_126905 [Annulohypoxylon truncatum]|uniref:uncharacterized protein n=1 Tax=Annulohypoxylon truncatum TaxID=327061 RepID=UPI0020083578|nr:uncharacterized protein F4807DRAFT_126905 [Annulohypoxylon truncatum]KAI1214404.1 hypothetical protein F4807DRAFT_126905 [Annulohypoxylon truncatum]